MEGQLATTLGSSQGTATLHELCFVYLILYHLETTP
jgi:hypothetical protein